MSSTTDRTDVAVVGPINDLSAPGGGQVFTIASIVNGAYYMLGYDLTKSEVILAEGGMSYYTGTPVPTGYKFYYWKFERLAGGAWALHAYNDAAGVSYSGKSLTVSGAALAMSTGGGSIPLIPIDRYRYHPTSSLPLTGLRYSPGTGVKINYYAKTGTVPSGSYKDLPTGIAADFTMTIDASLIFLPVTWYNNDVANGCSAVSTNGLIYQQCILDKAGSKTSTGYYTSFCGPRAKMGFTNVAECVAADGYGYYYQDSDGWCGDGWEESNTMFDGSTVTATTTYGKVVTQVCMRDGTGDHSFTGVSDPCADIPCHGKLDCNDCTLTNCPGLKSICPKNTIAWWIWVLIIIAIVIAVAGLLFGFLKKGKCEQPPMVESPAMGPPPMVGPPAMGLPQ